MSALVCLASCPDAALAQRIAAALVEARLAACVTCLPGARSTYRWNGALTVDDEVVLVIKTSARCLPALGQRLQALHPFEVPELVALPVTGGLPAYLRWIDASTASGEDEAEP